MFQVHEFNSENHLEARVYRKRAFRPKTKLGCLVCKAKRVKCDESRPACRRCRRNARKCAYALASKLPDHDSNGSGALSSNAVNSPKDPSTSPASDLVLLSATWNELPPELVIHMAHKWDQIFEMPYSRDIIPLFRSSRLVRNSILAMAACHFRIAVPDSHSRILEHYYQYLALQDYQDALYENWSTLTETDALTLLLSGALLSLLAFTLPTENPQPTRKAPHPSSSQLDWLALQGGMRPLVQSGSSLFKPGLAIITRIFLGDSDSNGNPISTTLFTCNAIPPHWTTFFNLPQPNNPLILPIKALSQLRHSDSSHSRNVFWALPFLGKVSPEFRALLAMKDEKAIWAYGYWSGILCRFKDVWWSSERAGRDYAAACLWFDQLKPERRPGEEGRAWHVMIDELRLVSSAQ